MFLSVYFFFFKQKTAYEMRISDWSSDVCSSDLGERRLVCTELRVELTGDRGERSERVWLHPGSFDASAVVDRVRWQLAEDAQSVQIGRASCRERVCQYV